MIDRILALLERAVLAFEKYVDKECNPPMYVAENKRSPEVPQKPDERAKEKPAPAKKATKKKAAKKTAKKTKEDNCKGDTEEDVRAVLVEFVNKFGRDETLQLLDKYGAKKVGDLTKTDYPRIYKEAREKIDE